MQTEGRDLTAIGIIPARYGSTRLEAKALKLIAGKPMIQHVWENCVGSKTLKKVVVATDDIRIESVCKEFGAEVVMTPSSLNTGTDRIEYAYRELDDSSDIVFNIQGDEPFVNYQMLDNLFNKFSISLCDVGTLVKRISSQDELFNPNVVKAIMRVDNSALYFSRSTIPHLRGVDADKWLEGNVPFYKHYGIYAYRSEALQKFVNLPQSPLELSESLEQLRLLENNFRIFCLETDVELVSVDTQEDLEKVEKILLSYKL